MLSLGPLVTRRLHERIRHVAARVTTLIPHVRNPLPYVAEHIQRPIRACRVGATAANRAGARPLPAHPGQHGHLARTRECTAPGKRTTVVAPGGVLPFGFRRHALVAAANFSVTASLAGSLLRAAISVIGAHHSNVVLSSGPCAYQP